jgi:hypothetical protein
MYTCEYCNNSFANKASYYNHIKRAKYCLKLRGEKSIEHICQGCKNALTSKQSLNIHKETCIEYQVLITMIDKDKQISELNERIMYLTENIKELQNKLENIAIKAVSRPTINTTKNTQINNYIEKLECVTDEHLRDQAQYLTIGHIKQGAEGYADFALEKPLKNRIICVDYARRKVKFKDVNGNINTDPEMSTLATKFFQSIKDQNKNLIFEYGNELKDKFGEELDTIVQMLEYKTNVDNSADGTKSDFFHEFVKSICGKTIPDNDISFEIKSSDSVLIENSISS